MITIFNRKELFVGKSMERFNEVRGILKNHNIKYTYRVMDRNSSNVIGSKRGRTGTFGQNLSQSKTYYIYVYRKDYDEALGLIRRM